MIVSNAGKETTVFSPLLSKACSQMDVFLGLNNYIICNLV